MKNDTVTVPIAAAVSQGMPFSPTRLTVTLPVVVWEEGEEVYTVADDSLEWAGAARGDLLLVEPKETANTGELVIVRKGMRVFVGRWWAKHGRKDVVSDSNNVVVSKPIILGAVNMILRGVQVHA